MRRSRTGQVKRWPIRLGIKRVYGSVRLSKSCLSVKHDGL
jgi:hypothetical protein